ncbi:uncharacterized protein SCHCODRAFT_02506851 [Schizophyllum commune H4-8]|uniref:Expressed protein n=1 Tax=Schizophyllum commune (strain H4-8 / FGSC 9210) TaxID=578458 RepID=D8QAD4_SCHCM|nr:uncharacterized protein SCHCODRAFT_02506851 [Schizophyllum commune H4-8]KAI5890048.1 hypothetical protein SCHCODRAFT_02506851 [Schizophyllum commune H4-8]
MADVCNTDLDCALYAVRLHDRLANEKSPAALRHREWRRERLNRIYRDFLQNVSALRYEVDLRDNSQSAANSFAYIERVLAPNIVHQRLPVPHELVDDDKENNREDHLTVVFSPNQFALKQQIKDRLEERGLVVIDDKRREALLIELSIPDHIDPEEDF